MLCVCGFCLCAFSPIIAKSKTNQSSVVWLEMGDFVGFGREQEKIEKKK